MQATLDAGAANAASALTQIDNLNSEPAAAMAERFKLVATVHGEKRRHNQKRLFGKTRSRAWRRRPALPIAPNVIAADLHGRS